MKKDLYVNLLTLIKRQNFTRDELKIIFGNENKNIESLLKLSDEEVEDILNTTKFPILFSKLYFHLNKENLEEDVQKVIKDSIDREDVICKDAIGIIDTVDKKQLNEYFSLMFNCEKSYQTKYVVQATHLKRFLRTTDSLEILKLIFTAKNLYIAESLYKLLINVKSVERKNLKEIAEIIAGTSMEHQTECAFKLADNPEYKNIRNITDFMRVLASTEYSFQAKNAFSIIDSDLLVRKDGLEIVKIIANAQKDYQAENASIAGGDPDILRLKDAIDIIKTIASSKEEYQASCSQYASSSVHLARSKYALEVVKLISEAKEEYQASCAASIAADEELLAKENYLDYIKTVLNTQCTHSTELIPLFINNTQILQHPSSFEIIKLIANAKEQFQVQNAYNLALDGQILNQKNALELFELILNSETEKQALAIKNAIVEETNKPVITKTSDKKVSILELSKIDEIDSLIESVKISLDEEINDKTMLVKVQCKKKV